MPANRVRTRRSRTPGYEVRHRYQILTGGDFFGAYGEGEHFDHRTAQVHWQEHRAELLAYWTQPFEAWRREHGQTSFENPEPGGPGTRPWAWWEFEAPGPRRRVGGTGAALPDAPLSFGCPVWYDGDYLIADPPRYEPERAYLTRHGLLDSALDG